MLVVFVGAPGAGKGTQAVQLADWLQVPHLSTGEMLRAAIDEGTELGQQAERYMSAGELVPDQVVVDMVAECLQQPDYARGCLLDGFPRTVAQAEALDKCLADHSKAVDRVIVLEVEDEELVRRLLARKRADDNLEAIQQRLVVYRGQTEPLVDYYGQRELVRLVDGNGTPEEVAERIRAHFP